MRYSKHPRFRMLANGSLLPVARKIRKLRVVGVEDTLQAQAEEWLDWLKDKHGLNLEYIHIPNSLWDTLFALRPKTNAAIAECSNYLGGVSDLLILLDGSYIAVELKSPGKTPRPSQKLFSKAVGGTWCDNMADFKKIVSDWLLSIGTKTELLTEINNA